MGQCSEVAAWFLLHLGGAQTCDLGHRRATFFDSKNACHVVLFFVHIYEALPGFFLKLLGVVFEAAVVIIALTHLV